MTKSNISRHHHKQTAVQCSTRWYSTAGRWHTAHDSGNLQQHLQAHMNIYNTLQCSTSRQLPQRTPGFTWHPPSIMAPASRRLAYAQGKDSLTDKSSQYNTVQRRTVQYRAVQCSAVHCKHDTHLLTSSKSTWWWYLRPPLKGPRLLLCWTLHEQRDEHIQGVGTQQQQPAATTSQAVSQCFRTWLKKQSKHVHSLHRQNSLCIWYNTLLV